MYHDFEHIVVIKKGVQPYHKREKVIHFIYRYVMLFLT